MWILFGVVFHCVHICICSVLQQMPNNGMPEVQTIFIYETVLIGATQAHISCVCLHFILFSFFPMKKAENLNGKRHRVLTILHTLAMVFHVAVEWPMQQWTHCTCTVHGLIIKPNRHVVLMTRSYHFDVIAIVDALTLVNKYSNSV